MTPYYEDDWVTLLHGDARELLPPLLACAHPTTVVTDPPYGHGHYETDRAVDVELFRLLATAGSAAIFGYPELLVRWCVAAGVVPNEWVTWWPTNGALRGTNMHGLWKETECVAVFGEHRFNSLRIPRTASSARIIEANYDIGAKGRGDTHGDPDSRRLGDCWTDSAPGLAFQSHQRLHPNEKPLPVMRRLVEGMAPGTILDPFTGSGTTLRAAKDLGRKAIGIEIEERYCEVAAKRFAQEVFDFGAAS